MILPSSSQQVLLPLSLKVVSSLHPDIVDGSKLLLGARPINPDVAAVDGTPWKPCNKDGWWLVSVAARACLFTPDEEESKLLVIAMEALCC
jgi:hypothetical protein